MSAKKKRSVFATIMIVLGGTFVFFLVVATAGFVLFLRSDTGKKVAGVMGEAMKMSKRAQNAPGTKELRGIGCAQAMVITPEDFDAISAQLDAGPPPLRDTRSGIDEMVICSVNLWSDPPPCDLVAATYLRAVASRSGPFTVTSQKAGKQASCTFLYDANGARLRDLTHAP
jgi:hypothetical protein